jgi:hypothetical protein
MTATAAHITNQEHTYEQNTHTISPERAQEDNLDQKATPAHTPANLDLLDCM